MKGPNQILHTFCTHDNQKVSFISGAGSFSLTYIEKTNHEDIEITYSYIREEWIENIQASNGYVAESVLSYDDFVDRLFSRGLSDPSSESRYSREELKVIIEDCKEKV